MKELKFRAWDKKFKVMITDDTTDEELYELWKKDDYTDFLYKEDEWYPVREISILFYFNNLFKNERLELMQSTGLFDKNGVEIFEGDILLGYCVYPECNIFESKLIGEVYYSSRGTWDCYSYILGGFNEQVEVIGNIHEHKHLLEVE